MGHMTASELIQLILAIGVVLNAFVGVAGALVGLFTFFQSRANGLINSKVAEVNEKLSNDMAELATNTNSIKDALVKATGEVAFSKGNAAGLAQGRSEGLAPEPVKVEIVKIPPLPKS